MGTESMTMAFRAADAVQAALLRQALEENGIPTVAKGGDAAFTFGELPLDVIRVEIWVPSNLAAEASRVIAGARRPASDEPSAGAAWTCPTCGESNERG